MKSTIIFFTLMSIQTWASPLHFDNEVSLNEAKGIVDTNLKVRQDMIPEIESRTRGSSVKRRALLQLTRDYQNAIEHIQNETLAEIDARSIVHSEFCVRYAFPENGYYEASLIHGKMLNTLYRSKIGLRINTLMVKALPYAPASKDWIKECRFLKRKST